MNTQLPIINVASTQSTARAAVQTDASTAEVPFNQVLNKKISSDESNKPNAKTANQDASRDPATSSTPSAQPASGTSSASATGNDDVKSEPEINVTDPASAQLLALVANLAQPTVKPTSTSSDNSSDVAPPAPNVDKQLNSQIVVPQLDAAGVRNALTTLAGDDEKTGKKPEVTLLQRMATDPGEKPTAAAAFKLTPTAAETPLADKTLSAKEPRVASPELATSARNVQSTELPIKIAETAQPQTASINPALQQTMPLNQQNGMVSQATTTLPPPVGKPGWDQALGQKVIWMVNGAQQSASLTLNPPDLGPLQVVLHVNNAQADATFITAQPEVKQALEAAMPKLREMMGQVGIQLGEATVNTGLPNHQQSASQQQAQSGRAALPGAIENDNASDLNVAALAARRATSSGQGLVDTFA